VSRALTEDNAHTIAIDDMRVTAGSAGASWSIGCHEDGCRAIVIGFDGRMAALSGGVMHLIWHLNGKPECRECGAWLDRKGAKRCPKGTCEASS
jgi:hypothetical protein